ncbi:MAG: alpha-ketoacid dehydrogenase subunit beta [Chloroflexi bacterium]|nr:alpha-ketoacid dehydrogenase subunit beta [Chloroflexota bacterium]
MREITFAEAVLEAIQEEMRHDSRVFYMGIDVSPPGVGATGRLRQEFGDARVRLTPITEATNSGVAIGAAAAGMRPIVNLLICNFGFVAFDQIANHAANFHYMYGGQASLPIVYRQSFGAGRAGAAQHSSSVYPSYLSVPGLKIALPSTPYDAKGLMKSAIRDDNPVLFFEDGALGGSTGPVPEEEYLVPLGRAEVKRQGTDITVVALGSMVRLALEAAEDLASDGIQAEVLDPRTLVPFDDGALCRSVGKTGCLVIVDQSSRTAGAAAEVAARVCEDPQAFAALRAPVARVCCEDVPIPFSPPLERYVIPSKEKLRAAILRTVQRSPA